MFISVGKVNCYLCSKTADIIPHAEAAAITRIHCQNCGEYVITAQAIHILELSSDDFKYILSSQTFEKFYYEQKPFTIKKEHIENAKDIPTSEKLYKLSNYIFQETKKRGLGTSIEISCSRFYCRNNDEYLNLLEILKSMQIIEFEKIGGTNRDNRVMIYPPKLLGKAMLAFEEGINSSDDFKKVFMKTNNNGNNINLKLQGDGNQLNFANDNANITATQNNSIDIKALNTLIENILNSLPQDIDNNTRNEIKENLSVIQSEVQNPNPKKTIIKNSYNVLDGIAKATGFLASLVKLYEFIKPFLL